MEAQIKVGMDATGVEVSAEKVKKSLSSIQNQIQRTTATLAGGEKGSRQFYEALANQRGVSVASLKPYLDQLDAAKMKASAAAKATDGMKSAVESLGPKLAAVFSGAAIVGFASKLVSVQREFADRVAHLKAVGNAVSQQRQEFDRAFASLQHRAFSGQL